MPRPQVLSVKRSVTSSPAKQCSRPAQTSKKTNKENAMTSSSEESKIKLVVELLTGPVSGLFVVLVILYGIASYVPKVIDRHFATVDRILDEHAQDREVYQKTMSDLTRELSKMSDQNRHN